MALFKSNDADTATITSSGSVIADPGKLLSLQKVQSDLAQIEALYRRQAELGKKVELVRVKGSRSPEKAVEEE